MANAMLDALSGLVSPALVSQLAGRLGESEGAVSSGLGTALTTILAGLAGKAQDGALMKHVLELASTHASQDTSVAGMIESALAGGGTGNNAQIAGLLGSLFGGSGAGAAGGALSSLASAASGAGAIGAVGDVLARVTGLRASSAMPLLMMAGPMVLKYLGTRARQSGLDATGLASLLQNNAADLRAALPGPLAGALGFAEPTPRVAERVVEREPVRRPVAPPPKEQGSWLPLGLAGLVAAGFIGYCATRPTTQPEVVAARDTAIATATATVAAAGEVVRATLPGGVELSVPPNGIEARLVEFLKDPNRVVSDTTWFDFDRLLFETNSAALKPESREQLEYVAKILAAYPDVRAKIGGYTDNTGDPAKNLTLSEERAASVRKELVSLGVADARLVSEGYGEKHPVADNATEEGRAKNRRIAMRVLAK